MPSLTIHMAIAKEYYKKYKNEINNFKEFESGSIAPDISKDKSSSHYGIWDKYNAYIDFSKFFSDENVDLTKDYWKGYFLHLVADYYFYNYNFKQEFLDAISLDEDFYEDYYFLNYDLIKDYNLEIREEIKNYMAAKNGTPKYLNYSKIQEFIEEILSKSIKQHILKIKNTY